MKLKSEVIRGEPIEIEVDSSGIFSAKVGEKWLRGQNLEELKQKLSVEVGRIKAKIAVRFFDTQLFRHCNITGLHATNGDYLLQYEAENGKDPHKDRGERHSFYRRALKPLTPEEVEEYKLLRAAMEAADNALSVFNKKHEFKDLRADVEAALKAGA